MTFDAASHAIGTKVRVFGEDLVTSMCAICNCAILSIGHLEHFKLTTFWAAVHSYFELTALLFLFLHSYCIQIDTVQCGSPPTHHINLTGKYFPQFFSFHFTDFNLKKQLRCWFFGEMIREHSSVSSAKYCLNQLLFLNCIRFRWKGGWDRVANELNSFQIDPMTTKCIRPTVFVC